MFHKKNAVELTSSFGAMNELLKIAIDTINDISVCGIAIGDECTLQICDISTTTGFSGTRFS